MVVVSETKLVEALAAWGAHEASGRLQGKVKCEITDKLNCINLALHYRAPYVARLLAREPLSTLLVEFEPSDIASVVLANGRTIHAWIQATTTSESDAHAYFCRLVECATPPEGQLIVAAELIDPVKHHLGAFMLYDGWHRAAAWVERNKQGKASNMAAFLVVTRHCDPLQSPKP